MKKTLTHLYWLDGSIAQSYHLLYIFFIKNSFQNISYISSIYNIPRWGVWKNIPVFFFHHPILFILKMEKHGRFEMAQFTCHLYGSIMVDSSSSINSIENHQKFGKKLRIFLTFCQIFDDFQCSEILSQQRQVNLILSLLSIIWKCKKLNMFIWPVRSHVEIVMALGLKFYI